MVKNVYKGEAPSRYLGSFAPWLLDRYQTSEYVNDLVKLNFRLFIQRALGRYDFKEQPIGIVGGFGYKLRNIFLEVAAPFGIRISKIVESPLEGLIQYHSND